MAVIALSDGFGLLDTLGSGGAIAPSLLCVAVWEMIWPEHKAAQPFLGRWVSNFSLFAGSVVLTTLLAPSLALITNAALERSLFRWAPGEAGFWLHLALALLVLDALNYVLHRTLHAVPLFWRLHALHHTDLALDVSTTIRHHPLEAVFTAVIIGAAGALLGCSAFEVAAYGMLETMVQLIGHADVRLAKSLNRVLGAVFVTPRFHRIHHSSARHETDSNYGQVFAFWDRLFGTSGGYADETRGTIEYGLKSFRDVRSQRLDQLLLLPVLAVSRD